MAGELREFNNVGTLAETLVWTDLVPDLDDPHHYVMDPATGNRWRRLTIEQEYIAEALVRGANYREACRDAGMKVKPDSASAFVVKLLRNSAPFINHVISLLIEARQSGIVTQESHLKRLDDLGRRAEKSGKFSAAIAAEVARGRVAGLYAKDGDQEDKRVLATVKDIDQRINQLLGKMASQEKAIEAQIVSDQAADD